MIQKWIGAALVFSGCAGFGFLMAASYRKEEKLLQQTKRLLEKMECELSCRVTSLPQLCQMASDCGETLQRIYAQLAEELNKQVMPDVASCMQVVLNNHPLPQSVQTLHSTLGQTLGMFDLEGQLQQLQAVKTSCEDTLSQMREHREEKLRSYQTLGLCAGAALAILLL